MRRSVLIAKYNLDIERKYLAEKERNDHLLAALSRWRDTCNCQCEICHHLEMVFLNWGTR